MATARDMIDDAMRELGILASEEKATGKDADFCLKRFNRMIFAWEQLGVDVNHTAYALGTTFALDAKHERGVVALLAIDIAGPFSEPISADLARRGREGWDALSSDYWLFDDMQVDSALQRMPSQRRRGIL